MLKGSLKNPFDTSLYHAINGLSGHNHLLDHIFMFFAKDALEIYAVLFIISWFALPRRDIRSRHALLISGLSGILALVFNVIISHIWFRPRPFTVIPNAHQLLPHSSDASFPSDHTAGSFGFASGTWGSQRIISYTFTILAIIVMFSRVYCGLHYPTDVIAGMFVGMLSGKIIKLFSKFIFPVTTLLARLFKFGPPINGKTRSYHS